MQLRAGKPAIPFTATDIYHNNISLKDYKGRWVLLSFLRFVTCPRCSLRLYSLSLRYQALREKGLDIITFVESPADLILQRPYAIEAPYPIIADPEQHYYNLYGSKNSRWGLFWGGRFRKAEIREAAKLGFGQPTVVGNDYRMPADFLIDPDQIVRVAHYGRDSGDHLVITDLERRDYPVATAVVAR